MKRFNSSLTDDLFCLKGIFLLHQRLLSVRSLRGILPLVGSFVSLGFFCNEEGGMVTDKTQYDFAMTYE